MPLNTKFVSLLPGRWVVGGVLGLALVGCGQPPAEPEESLDLTSDNSKASYSIGYDTGRGVAQRLPADLDADAFAAGAGDGLKGLDRQVDEAEAKRTLDVLASEVQANAQAQMEQIKEAGVAFLAENSKKEGVVTLQSGLQYQILTPAPDDAPKPTATDSITAHYHGTLTDGTVFDSSVQQGAPATFPLNRVIAGWTEALQLMGVGAKWRLFIPSELGYRDQPAGAIPPNSTLIFEVELLEIQGPAG